MYITNIQSLSRKSHENNKNICDAFGCCSEGTEKLSVNAGTFGSINLNLCSKCVTIFKGSEV